MVALPYAPPDAGQEPLPAIVWPLLALGALLLFNLFFTKGFFSITMNNGHLYGSLIDVLNRGAPVMLLAMGMTLVIATGGIDISVGAVMAISARLPRVCSRGRTIPFAPASTFTIPPRPSSSSACWRR